MFEEAGSTLEMVIPGRVEGNRGKTRLKTSLENGITGPNAGRVVHRPSPRQIPYRK
jgi:hypothetical protein